MFEFLFGKSNEATIKPVVLLVLDGFGEAPSSPGNAIKSAKMPAFDYLYATYPHGKLIAAGESVGLPANEAGSSEVGHLTIGAGRVVYQSLPRIDRAIKDGTFFSNDAFLAALSHARKNNSVLHLAGLLSSGSVHSSARHLYALLDLAARNDFKNLAVHVFIDGRDAPPKEAIDQVTELSTKLSQTGVGRIATVSGRYYAMDRDARWERTQKCYEAMAAGVGPTSVSAIEAVKAGYAAGLTDEFLLPTVIVPQGESPITVNNNDALIFYNFRVDRPRQITMAFTMHNFESLKSFDFAIYESHGKIVNQKWGGVTFKRSKLIDNLFCVTMTRYQDNIPVSAVAFEPLVVDKPLAALVASQNMKQVHLAESEKERMVTFYFDGAREEKQMGEVVDIVPSPKVATYDLKPEMSVYGILERFKKYLKEDKYQFFVINFANPDMVAHSGSFPATVTALAHVDKVVGEVVRELEAIGGTLIITADHGNAEEMVSLPTETFFFTTEGGKINTQHSTNPVPVIIADPRFKGRNLELPQGSLSDIATTILGMMHIAKPDQMTGRDLLAGL